MRRAVLAAALSFTGVIAGLVAASPAQAQVVETGTLAFSGDPGDWVSGGQAYAYDTADGDRLNISSNAENSVITISLDGFNGDWWHLDFEAPDGAALAPGVYERATRYPFNGAGPGLSLGGNGRGCNTLTGTFTVTEATFGPSGYVEAFGATFEQHCEGGSTAARGEVHIANPPAPDPLELGVVVATDGTASLLNGNATVHGTVTCTQPVTVPVNGTVVQNVFLTLIRASYGTSVNCVPGESAEWTATAVPTGTTPFTFGRAEVTAQASAYDPEYGEYVTASTTSTVLLRLRAS
jgi:hypothetical protein